MTEIYGSFLHKLTEKTSGGGDDLLSPLIYVNKFSCVVFFKELLKENLHVTYNIQLLLSLGGSDPCLNLKPDPNLVHPSSFNLLRIRCIIPKFYPV